LPPASFGAPPRRSYRQPVTMLPLSDSPGPLAPHELAYVVYSNLGLMAVNLICLFTFVWTQHRRTVKYYDRSIRILEEEQGEWFVNFVIERELAKLLKHYTRAGADPEKTLDEHECEHECGCGEDDECEDDECDCECHEGTDSDDEDDEDDEDGEDVDDEGCDCDDDDCECHEDGECECECDDDCEDCLCECHEDAEDAEEDDEADEDYVPDEADEDYVPDKTVEMCIPNETNKNYVTLGGAAEPGEDKGPCKGCGADADCGKRWADADGNKCLRAHVDSWVYEGGKLVKRAMVAVDAPAPDAKMAEGGADSAEGMGKSRRG